MLNKYKKAISKIHASEEIKDVIIEKMQEEQIKRSGDIIMKIKNFIIYLLSLIGIITCGGLAYATATGKMKFGVQEIVFSDEYINYEETVENQCLEKDGTKVELVSTMCDDGFVVLKFEVELSDEIANMEDASLAYMSFNDEFVEEDGYRNLYLAGANYNVIIDGEKYWLRGGVDSEVIENIKNKSYTVYQLYFLPSDKVENKETFTITLDNVVVAIYPDNEGFIEMDGAFEIEVSKEKALQNTTTITNDSSCVKYGRLTNKIEKVSQTPMQTIIKVSSLFVDADTRNSTYLLAEDYIGDLTYKVYDQDNNELFVYTSISGYEFYYEDGTVQKISMSDTEGQEEYGYNKMLMEEYIVTEKNKDIKSLRIEVYETNDYFGITRNIGTHYINLETEQISAKDKNEIVEESEDVTEDYYGYKNIRLEEIEYFDIEINKQYDILCSYIDFEKIINENDEKGWSLEYKSNVNEENARVVMYEVNLWEGSYDNFTIILFKDKTLFDMYYEEYSEYHEMRVIDENDEYKLAVMFGIELTETKAIKEVVDTIKLK